MTDTTRVTTTTKPRFQPAAPTEHPSIQHLVDDVNAISLRVATTVTLGDLVRLGAGSTTKLEGGFVEPEATCAFGAAYIAGRALGYMPKA